MTNTIPCASVKSPRRLGADAVLQNLFTVQTTTVTLQQSNRDDPATDLPFFHDLQHTESQAWHETMLRSSLPQILEGWMLSIADFVGLSGNLLQNVQPVTICHPLVMPTMFFDNQSEASETPPLICELRDSPFCQAGFVSFSLADERFEIAGVDHHSSVLPGLLALLTAVSLLFCHDIILQNKNVSQLIQLFFFHKWFGMALASFLPQVPAVAVFIAVGLVMRLFAPSVLAGSVRLALEVASAVLISNASSFAFGSIILLAFYFFVWVITLAVRLAAQDEQELEEEIQEEIDEQSDQLKQEGLKEIVDEVFRNPSLLSKLSDQAVKQVMTMAKKGAMTPDGKLDDLSDDQHEAYNTYKEGLEEEKRLKRERWLPVAVAFVALGLWQLQFGVLVYNDPLMASVIAGGLVLETVRRW